MSGPFRSDVPQIQDSYPGPSAAGSWTGRSGKPDGRTEAGLPGGGEGDADFGRVGRRGEPGDDGDAAFRGELRPVHRAAVDHPAVAMDGERNRGFPARDAQHRDVAHLADVAVAI